MAGFLVDTPQLTCYTLSTRERGEKKMTLRITEISHEEQDSLMEFVWDEQAADRNMYSPIVDVQV